MASSPEWTTALIGAVIAALGYVAQRAAEGLARIRREEKNRRAQLAELLALIRAGNAAFKVQCENRDRLALMIYARDESLKNAGHSYDRLLALAFPSMPESERELHAVIRAYTVHTFRPLNEALTKWLSTDTHFRVRRSGKSARSQLGACLEKLEAHLLLWHAKYTAWIPDHPERALVYLGDEEKHGTPFPRDGAKLVEAVLEEFWISE